MVAILEDHFIVLTILYSKRRPRVGRSRVRIPKAGQILHSVAIGSLQHLRRLLCCLGGMTRRWAPPTRYTLRRNTANVMKGLVLDITNSHKHWINCKIEITWK